MKINFFNGDRMDFKNLNTLIQVVELGSFTRAGEKLGYSQPTISFQIRQLEEELGVQLFDRINHSISLTSQGKEVLAFAYEICQRVNDMEEQLKNNQQVHGTVRIGMADSMCSWLLDGQFATLRQQFPGIFLQITTASTEGILQLLDQNEVDLAYTLDRHVYSRDYIIAGEEKIDTHFVTASGDPLADSGAISMSKLVSLPCILTEHGMSYRSLLEQYLARHSLQIDPILEIGNTDLICRLVEKGIGIAFLPDYVTEQAVKAGSLARLQVKGLSIEIWKQLLYHRNKSLTPPIKTVMSFLLKKFECETQQN